MENTVFEIAGEKFNVVTKGAAQARQIAHVGQWLARYAAPAYKQLTNIPVTEDGGSTLTGMDIAVSVLGALSPEALIDLFVTVFGCTKAFADANFDIGLLIDGAISFYENSDALKKVVGRFFSNSNLKLEEKSNSMPSEQPTDGPTTE